MNRMLQWFNLLGVAALAGLCVVQWSVNRRVNLEAAALEQTRISQAAKIAEQDKTIHDQAADLDDFRQRLELSETELTDTLMKLNVVRADRDRLKSELDKWVAAVAQRDQTIKQAVVDIQKLVAERDDLVKKYNALVSGGGK
jgi:septal ring factor EnvC (AmiA/AmiB activator)